MLFECHVTVPRQHAAEAEKVAKEVHWKFSQIDGDPVLGKETFAYLTTHDTDYSRMMRRMSSLSDRLDGLGVEVLREKIELIMYDTKKGVQL